ncbi:MAG: nitrate reductase molybdenum cofactor assembly chaperone [Burkholderiaceae bacterium]|jgi:nitrate reductase delta subunit|nr:nitrate reductase molybdenum cofactor assembly chaperone [Pseudomonadota bacterium]MCO5117145.1 nitrate reductase molybdenum cofactor assembly chaperone [Burkholderiaceae bacterium]MCP5217519.1 nitrate reductase molybdenum cofactor assembly chaperone [Burkholderiaceae bacterium]
MFNKPPESMRLTLRALARLLAYPDAELRAQLPALIDALQAEQTLPAARVAELQALAQQLGAMDPYEAEERYVETFDRGRRTSLHLFEHIHGDSRERGPALIDLTQTYEKAGLRLDTTELPDHLGVVLEFASTQPPAVAREFLAEMAHVLGALFSALQAKDSPYASVVAAVLEAAGEKAQAVAIAPEPELDEAWAEPEAFDGCATRGQNRPGQPQTVHFVRKARSASSSQGVSP